MAWSPDDIPDQSGKTALVTGANSGIGYHAALELARRGAHVVLACRSEAKGQQALTSIQSRCPNASIELSLVDLADLSSVRAFCERTVSHHDRLDLLVNNAGVMAIPKSATVDGFEMQIGVNHLGHFALTGLLLERLLQSGASRVVNVSSLAHRMGRMNFDDLQASRKYDKGGAYGASKRANLLFTYELQRRLEAADAAAISVGCHPGYAATNLQQVGPSMTGSRIAKALMGASNLLFAQSAERGAWPTLYAATSQSVRGGQFIGPRGPGNLHGAPQPNRSSGASRDPDSMRRLWELSVDLTGVDYAALATAKSA